jgi:hypothetical protein
VLTYGTGKEKMTERNIFPETLIVAQLVKKSPAANVSLNFIMFKLYFRHIYLNWHVN